MMRAVERERRCRDLQTAVNPERVPWAALVQPEITFGNRFKKGNHGLRGWARIGLIYIGLEPLPVLGAFVAVAGRLRVSATIFLQTAMVSSETSEYSKTEMAIRRAGRFAHEKAD